ncbi:nuclease domain-containing protein [Pseudomonas sp. TNT3]|uniref:nuclease domain-containing protein n=1 Tax=Pseudomonas sp. TNT3 TaxID=2654097 RepID=UPI0013909F37|nr:nuclease domain-containing protein [Pseudomonas sp. TNT3]KAI2689542.1 restriction endonuclease-like protein [Pseudomonas sp. TNT3]
MAVIHYIDKLGRAFSVSPDGVEPGFVELGTYYFKVVPQRSFFVDDEPLQTIRHGAFDAWQWTPMFYAGKVSAELVDEGGVVVATYHFDVAPDQSKVGEATFAAMLDEILAFDSRLLLGDEYAQRDIGREGRVTDPHLSFARLKRYGPTLLTALTDVIRKPLTRLRRERTLRPAHQLRRIDHQTLRRALQDPAATALLYHRAQTNTGAKPLQFDVPSVFEDLDNPANQAMAVVLDETIRRCRQVITDLRTLLTRERDTDTRSALAPRLGRRIEYVEGLHSALRKIQRREPFCSLRQRRITAAGLNAISAHPAYARAYRYGWYVLRPGIDGSRNGERLWISPTWEIYERWCYLKVVATLKSLYPELSWTNHWPGTRVDVIRCTGTGNDTQVDVWLQVQCPAFDRPDNHGFTSVSGERYPDIVVTVKGPQGCKFIVMDAKYRVTRTAVLDAMESAHLYRDCLRWNGMRPDRAVLLVPRRGGAPWLEAMDYHEENQVGVAVLGDESNGLVEMLRSLGMMSGDAELSDLKDMDAEITVEATD